MKSVTKTKCVAAILRLVMLAAVAAMLGLSGCAAGPDYARPKLPVSIADRYYNQLTSSDSNDIVNLNQWWKGFHDEVTSEIVEDVLKNNYSLKAAAARLVQAQAAFKYSTGLESPDISVSFSRVMSRVDSGTPGSALPDTGVAKTRIYEPKVNVSYVLDLFGKLKRNKQAAWADLLAQKANEQALINSIIATTVKLRINIATIQKQLSIAKANTKSLADTLEIIQRRYEQGLVGPIDVYLGKENLAYARSVEPVLELAQIKAGHSLDVLLGKRPGGSEEFIQTLGELPEFEPVNVGLPAGLLDRRPDIMASEYKLTAASEKIGYSMAQLYPDLTLIADFGWSSQTSNNIFASEAQVYSTIFAVAAPIFNGGKIRANIDAAKAKFDELAADYALVVLTALKEVEDTLVTEQKYRIRLEHVKFRFKQAKSAEDLAQRRYQRGVEKILTVLESQRRRRNAENDLALLKSSIWMARVDLYLSLGGDWQTEENTNESQNK